MNHAAPNPLGVPMCRNHRCLLIQIVAVDKGIAERPQCIVRVGDQNPRSRVSELPVNRVVDPPSFGGEQRERSPQRAPRVDAPVLGGRSHPAIHEDDSPLIFCEQPSNRIGHCRAPLLSLGFGKGDWNVPVYCSRVSVESTDLISSAHGGRLRHRYCARPLT